jgi:PAS domain S-box-containing protein
MVYIQKVLVNGVQEAGPCAVSARHGNGELAFQYTAVSFIAPQKIRFRYKLEGYDENWVDAGSQRNALYANLRPGRYRFDVHACNVDGVWSADSASFDVELPPLFYQTLWFRLAMGGGVLLCLAGVYTWRTRHLRKKEKSLKAANELLENRIQERTKELVEGRNLLRIMIDNLPDSVFVKDTEGRVIIDNIAHARYLGFEDTSQSRGKSDFDCFTKEKADEFRRPELRLLESGKEYTAEENLTLKNGEIRWMLTTKVPLRDAHGKITGLAGINRDITERKKWEHELETLHKQLLDTSRQAGMAEVATSVLHNVGNVLNSVNVSASIVDEQIRAPSLERLQKAIGLLKDNRANLTEFLQDKNGAKVVSYLEALLTVMEKERSTIRSEIKALSGNIEHIKKIVSMQQSYARIAGVSEIVNPIELLEDSLRLHEVAYQRHFIKVLREYSDVPKISVDRHKVIQILVNLLSNAKYACAVNDPATRIVRLRLCNPVANRVRIEVIDNGMGILSENLTRIFSYGFTTRKNGHGFGLHSGALAAREMGGSLTVRSDGLGKGAAFVLELPLEDKLTRRHARDQARQLTPA